MLGFKQYINVLKKDGNLPLIEVLLKDKKDLNLSLCEEIAKKEARQITTGLHVISSRFMAETNLD